MYRVLKMPGVGDRLMLQPALAHEAALKAAWLRVALKPEFRFLFGVGGWHDLTPPKLETSDWNKLQMVSVDQGEVLGYFEADMVRTIRDVSELKVVNFTGQANMTFARDLARFFKMLLTELGLHAIRWSVAVGNPAERIYDRLIRRYGGRMIGVSREYFVMPDGSLHDRKQYEILVREFNHEALVAGPIAFREAA